MKEKKKRLKAALEKSLGTLARHFIISITEETYRLNADGYIEVEFVPPRSTDYLMTGVAEMVWSSDDEGFSIQKAVWEIRRQLHEWGVL